jgi:hypothetical protein
MISLGTDAFEAITRVRGAAPEEWRVITKALTDYMARAMHAAIETGNPDHSGYARAFRDVVWFFEVVEAGPNAPERSTMKPAVPSRPPPEPKELARVR